MRSGTDSTKEARTVEPIVIAALTTEHMRNMEREIGKETHDMEPFTLYEYSRIRHAERLEWAMNQRPGETKSSLFWRMVAAAQRAIRMLLAVRVTLTVHTARRRSITEPDMCIE